MQRLTWRDLPSPGATLASGVTGGFVCGLLIGGVGGRLAMFVLRLTSDPSLRGARTDDDFIIGVFTSQTLFLLGVTAGHQAPAYRDMVTAPPVWSVYR